MNTVTIDVEGLPNETARRLAREVEDLVAHARAKAAATPAGREHAKRYRAMEALAAVLASPTSTGSDVVEAFNAAARACGDGPFVTRHEVDRGVGRWEIGLRNIVTILLGPDKKFEIADVVEQVRALAADKAAARARIEEARSAMDVRGRHAVILEVPSARSIESVERELLGARDLSERRSIEILARIEERERIVDAMPEGFGAPPLAEAVERLVRDRESERACRASALENLARTERQLADARRDRDALREKLRLIAAAAADGAAA